MRKIMLSGASALALTMAGGVANAAPPPALFNWSGFYFGGQIGGDWLKIVAPTDPLVIKHSAGIYGVHLGYNVQYGQWVWGLEGDVGRTSNNVQTIFAQDTYGVTLLASLRGRLGLAFDRVLVYATGGIGSISGKSHESTGENGHFQTYRPVVGGGIDYALTNQWIIGLEGLAYIGDKGKINPVPDFDPDVLKNVYVATFRITYRFGP
jgi:outer membrane immunogenic protein